MQIGFITTQKEHNDVTPPVPVFEQGMDYTCLGKGVIYPAKSPDVNANEIILGATGSGKSMSVCEPRILHTFNSSLVIPIVKRKTYDLYAPLLEERGYEVWDLNLAHPEKSNIGYDPCRGFKTEDDMLSLAGTIACTRSGSLLGDSDPYWTQAETAVIASLIGLSDFKKQGKGRFVDFIRYYKKFRVDLRGSHCETNYDKDINGLKALDPSSQIPKLWETLSGNNSKTSACIMSMVNNSLGRFTGSYGEALFGKGKTINIKALGKRKVALFVTTNTVSEPCQMINNILYMDIFKELFEEAESQGGSLSVPVHIIADDFACSSKINGFANYISVFRAAGISVSILLQSLTQLDSLYGEYEASTIRNNCDSWVYMGSMDIHTCEEMARRTDKTVKEIMDMKVGQIIVLRRGYGSVFTERYPILEDELYIQHILKEDTQEMQ